MIASANASAGDIASHHRAVRTTNGRRVSSSTARGSSARTAATLHMSEDGAVSIRRRPPQGPNKHELGVGQFEFLIEKVDENGERVDNVENRPRNILEEIVW